jgi:hypothetical protein
VELVFLDVESLADIAEPLIITVGLLGLVLVVSQKPK